MRIKPLGLLVVSSNGVRLRRDATEHVCFSRIYYREFIGQIEKIYDEPRHGVHLSL